MNHISFWNPVTQNNALENEKIAAFRCFEGYLSVSGKQYEITHINKNADFAEVRALSDEESSVKNCAMTALKVASYFTIVLPVIAIVGKIIYRNANTFIPAEDSSQKQKEILPEREVELQSQINELNAELDQVKLDLQAQEEALERAVAEQSNKNREYESAIAQNRAEAERIEMELTARIEVLENDLRDVRRELQEQRETHERAVALQEEKNRELQTEIQRNKEAAEQQAAALQLEIETIRRELDETNQSLAHQEEALRSETELRQTQVADLESKIAQNHASMERKEARLKQKIEELREQLDVANTQIAATEETLARMNQEHIEARAKLEAKFQEESAENRKTVQGLEETLVANTQELERVKARLELQEQEHTRRISEQKETLENLERKLKETVAATKARENELTTKIDMQSATIQELRKELEDLIQTQEERCKALESELQKNKSENSEKEQELIGELTEQKQKLEDLEASKLGQELRFEMMLKAQKKSVDALSDKLKSQEFQINERDSAFKALGKKLEGAVRENKNLRAELEKANQERAQLAAGLSELRRELQALRERNVTLVNLCDTGSSFTKALIPTAKKIEDQIGPGRTLVLVDRSSNCADAKAIEAVRSSLSLPVVPIPRSIPSPTDELPKTTLHTHETGRHVINDCLSTRKKIEDFQGVDLGYSIQYSAHIAETQQLSEMQKKKIRLFFDEIRKVSDRFNVCLHLSNRIEIQRVLSPRLDELLKSDHSGVNSQVEIDLAKADLATSLGVGVVPTSGGKNGAVFIQTLEGRSVGVFKAPQPIGMLDLVAYAKMYLGQARLLNNRPFASQYAEIFAADLSRELNFGEMAPKAIEAEFAGQRGAFISFLGGYQELKKAKRNFVQREKYHEKEIEMWQKMSIWNFLVGNLDPHDENIFVKIDSAHELKDIRMIDHGNCFPMANPGIGSKGNLGHWGEYAIAKEPFTDEMKAFILENITEDKIRRFVAGDRRRTEFFKDEMMRKQLERVRLLRECVATATGQISSPAVLAGIKTDSDYQKFFNKNKTNNVEEKQ